MKIRHFINKVNLALNPLRYYFIIHNKQSKLKNYFNKH